ncbi:hypothetical protein [Winogradskyella pulchriflava]|uniref:Uncharacterized protein n=1 Tax=Winogradskyella pulchriflava TaxID=1110688 RepID=A0ABV6QCP7_9FLAO
MKTLNRIGWIFTIIVIDVVLYITIGLILMNYEDFYNESEGEYFSLASMTLIEKIAFISYYLLIVANILLIIYALYKIVTKYIIKK